MRILHTADLHLDSAFCGTGTLGSDERRAAQRRLLERIFECAERERCDMMLIAGDLFDGRYVTPETAELALRLFRSARFPIIISPGNHDPYVGGSFYKRDDLPEGVYVFTSSELQSFDFDELGVSVVGYAFTSPVLSESPLSGATLPEKGTCARVLCAHADISSPTSRYAPVTVGDIVRLDIDYAALGHIHNRPEDDSFGSSTIRYCGFPEGRSYDEQGDGAVLIVDINKGEPIRVQKKVISEIRYISDTLELDSCEQGADVRALIGAYIAKLDKPERTNLRLYLVGEAEPEWIGDTDELARSLRGELCSLQIKDETAPYVDGAALERDITLRGALYRHMRADLMSDDAAVRRRASLALKIGLAAIDGKRIPQRSADE